VNHWEKDTSGGILFLPGRNVSSRPKPTGKRAEFFYLLPTTRNLFPFLRIAPDPPEALHPRHSPDLFISSPFAGIRRAISRYTLYLDNITIVELQ
jgi:hypothetical protein